MTNQPNQSYAAVVMGGQPSRPQREYTPRQTLQHLLSNIQLNNIFNGSLPAEIVREIVDYVHDTQRPPTPTRAQGMAARLPAAWVPPANNACPLMALPSELRREIFAESLPDRDLAHHPKCDDEKHPPGWKRKGVKTLITRNSPTVGLMLLNKKLCSEIAEVIYEERTFVIHVHEGLRKGGIEFLHAGRQPLQYQDCIDDERFWKFSKGDDFGFRRLKKICVQIFPDSTTGDEKCRHTAINTYFMNLALCRLLDRSSDKKNRITSLTIEFVRPESATSQQGRGAIQRTEQYWWDPDKQQGRESSVHGLPNIELVLRPLAILTGCHSVNFVLPPQFSDDSRMAAFISDLERSMTSKHRTMVPDDDLELQIESAREAMEDYVNYTLHGTRHHDIEKLTENEVVELSKEEFDAKDDDDGVPGRKHNLSPFSKEDTSGDEYKKQKILQWRNLAGNLADGVTDADDYTNWHGERAMKESLRLAAEAEERQMAQAIAASLGRQKTGTTLDDSDMDTGSDDEPPTSKPWFKERQHWLRVLAKSEPPVTASSAAQSSIRDHSSAFQSQGRTLAKTSSSSLPPDMMHNSYLSTSEPDFEDSHASNAYGPPSRTTAASSINLHNHGRPVTSWNDNSAGEHTTGNIRSYLNGFTDPAYVGLGHYLQDPRAVASCGPSPDNFLNPTTPTFTPAASTQLTSQDTYSHGNSGPAPVIGHTAEGTEILDLTGDENTDNGARANTTQPRSMKLVESQITLTPSLRLMVSRLMHQHDGQRSSDGSPATDESIDGSNE